jgi:hypothetical protein
MIMGAIDTVATLITGILWQVTGAHKLAVSLIRTALSKDEDSATVAAMMLVKGGKRAIGPVSMAIEEGEVRLADILVSIGTDEARNALACLSNSADSAVAAAAMNAAERMDRAAAASSR